MYIDVAGKYSGNAFGRLVSDNGLTANLYEQNGCAIKVFNLNYKKEAVYREAYIMSLIESLGIKLARVYQTGLRDGHHYIEMEYLNGPVQMDLMLQAIAADDKDGFFRLLREMTLIQLKIHSKPGVGLNSYCDLAAARIRASRHLDERQKQQTIDYMELLPKGDRVIHSDFHPINILYHDDCPVVIDWPDACCGNPVADAARTYLNFLYPPIPALQQDWVDLAGNYLTYYTQLSGKSSEEITAWLPVVAAQCLDGVDRAFSEKMAAFILR